MKTKTSFVMAGLLAFVLILGVANAAIISDPATLTLSGTESTTQTLTFSLENDDAVHDLENIVYQFSDLTYLTNTIDFTALTLTGSKTVIASLAIESMTLNINIPEGQIPGTYTGMLTVEGDYSGTPEITNIPIELTVTEHPSLVLDSVTVDSDDTSFDITVENDGNVEITNVQISIEEINKVTFTYDTTAFNLAVGETKTIPVTMDNQNSNLDDLTSTISLTSTQMNKTSNLEISKKTFCEFGERGDLEITNLEINNEGKGNDDEWERLDTIKIEVEVENKDDDSISTVEMQIMILDEDLNDVTEDFVDDDVVKIGKIKDDESESEIFEIKVGAKIDEGEYRIYIKAYQRSHEEDHCVDSDSKEFSDTYYETIEVITDAEVGFDDLVISDIVGCGSTVTVQLDMYNFDLGDDEDMRVNLYNSELGIDVYSDKFDLDPGKKEDLIFEFNIPEDAEEKTYKIKVIVEYDYDKDDETFDDKSSDAEDISLVVSGYCKVDLTPSITASLESEEVVEGKEIIVKVVVYNDDADAMFTIGAQGYETFADLVDVSPQVDTIPVNTAKEFLLKFKLNDDSAGDQAFSILVTSAGEVIGTQSVALVVEESSLFDFTNPFKEFDFMTMGIIALNVILLIMIIVITRKILNKRK